MVTLEAIGCPFATSDKIIKKKDTRIRKDNIPQIMTIKDTLH